MKRREGFTLIELVIVGGLIAAIAIVSVVYLGGSRRRAELDGTADQMATLLRSAQSRAASRESATAWGVHFENSTSTTPFYALYASSTYATSTTVTTYTLPASVEYTPSNLAAGATRDVLFAVGTGETSTSTSVAIRQKTSTATGWVIAVEPLGRVSLAAAVGVQTDTGYLMGSGTPTLTDSGNWTAPNDWYGDDTGPTYPLGNLARVSGTNSVSPTVTFSGFNFNIPDGSTINKICLHLNNVSIASSGAGTQRFTAALSWNGGSSLTTTNTAMPDITTTVPGGAEYYFSDESSAPASSDPGTSCTTWGRTWSVSEMSSSNFAVKLQMTNSDSTSRQLRFDVIKVKVYYTPS